MLDSDLYWLAGLLEGEGSFMKGPPSKPTQPRIVVSMTDLDVIERVATLFGNTVHPLKPREEHHKPAFLAKTTGTKAVGLMKQLRPLMGLRRQEQIDRAVASYKWLKGTVPKEDYDSIVARMNAGESVKQIAEEYGVTHWTLYRIRERVQNMGE